MASRFHYYHDTLEDDYISSFNVPLQVTPLDSEDASLQSPPSLKRSMTWSDSDPDSTPSTPIIEPQLHTAIGHEKGGASLTRISDAGEELRRILGDDEISTQLVQQLLSQALTRALLLPKTTPSTNQVPIVPPDNLAFKSLKLTLPPLTLDTQLTDIPELPEVIASLGPVPPAKPKHITKVHTQPPEFVQPHPPFHVHAAPLHHVRELTKAGAEKRTVHFDIDVTDYPDESEGVDFKVGGAIGICPPNDPEMVDEIFTLLGVPSFLRDKPVLLKTTGGRWPTIWGEDMARELVTTRRELMTWCADVQSQPATKLLLRLLAEHATSPAEKKILFFLVSNEGQPAFCDLRIAPHVTVALLLHAFPSSRPPLPALLSVLPQLMPRFYSLSNDPIISSSRNGVSGRKLIEMAVTVHRTKDWSTGTRTGIGSGYLHRLAQKYMDGEATGAPPQLYIPLFRGLMSNPLSQKFGSDGPIVMIGAGVGMAPFRGFILNRMKNGNCTNKIWLIQGIRDSSVDELYSGELGSQEHDIKRVVQSRKARVDLGEAKYVQDEVSRQADVVWNVANTSDGRIFVCGSSAGMGEGVREALVEVVMNKSTMNREQAEQFWDRKREDGQFIEVSTLMADPT